MTPVASRLRCVACGGAGLDPGAIAHRCQPPGVDHVLVPVLDTDAVRWPENDDENPYVRYRALLHGYAHWKASGGTDGGWVDLVGELDARVAGVDGRGFRTTPLLIRGRVVVKDETAGVAGSHKARHLFGTLLALETGPRLAGAHDERPLAIASCGNAALAAATLARAADRELSVFIPPWADPSVVARLRDLGAVIVTCPRRPDEPGDPCVHRFREAVSAGAVPFSCQGTDNALALDGGRTLAWELADQLGREGVDRIVVQVGGGALASSTARGLAEAVALGQLRELPRFHAVQAAGAAPLHRAWRLMTEQAATAGWEATLAAGASSRARFMWAWEQEPTSLATGILDDETYDWLEVVRAMAATNGSTVTVTDDELQRAVDCGRRWVPDVGPTGTAGLAGVAALGLADEERVAVIFTGRS